MGNQQVSTLTAIPDFDGYFFSEFGEIYSNRRGKMKQMTKIPHGGKTKKTYYRVKVKGKLVFVHRLVAAYQYGGEIPPDLHVNHIDGDTENNAPENLEVTTHHENAKHAQVCGLYCSGEAWYAARGMVAR